ncbi:MAG: carboxypeptidase-like regulatory domain-containing protein, partial [Kofleriaceae bacterium]
ALAGIMWMIAACGERAQAPSDSSAGEPDACDGLACAVVNCGAKGLPPTSISGTVYAPNGTLALYGATVYVPASDPGPLPEGVQCDRCNFLGGAVSTTVTDDKGEFVLRDVPATTDVPVVIQIGKWRRQLTIPNVAACQDLPLSAVETRLPKNKSEGDIPLIAITTGDADALECLVRKLGVDDTEFTTDTQGGRVHLFNGNGAMEFETGFAGGSGEFPNATALWNTTSKLSNYDITMFSCEGGQYPDTKSQAAMQAVHDYAGLGGRVFMSHWHNIWIGGEDGDPSHGLADWMSIMEFDYAAPQPDTTQLTVVDQAAPKGAVFATWLENVGASPVMRGQLQVKAPRYTAQSVDPAKGERWVYVDPTLSSPMGRTGVQNTLFTTPNEVPADQRCGKVVFSDMHVSSGSSSKPDTPFPGGCSASPMSPQEKALAFIFFDIATCLGPIF